MMQKKKKKVKKATTKTKTKKQPKIMKNCLNYAQICPPPLPRTRHFSPHHMPTVQPKRNARAISWEFSCNQLAHRESIAVQLVITKFQLNSPIG